jgi:hypothetical protein
MLSPNVSEKTLRAAIIPDDGEILGDDFDTPRSGQKDRDKQQKKEK